MSAVSPQYCLKALGAIAAVGNDLKSIWHSVVNPSREHLKWSAGLLPDRDVLVAEVSGELPSIPKHLLSYASRNSQLALAAYQQIEHQVQECIGQVGASRVGVVVGTSTSGIASGEAAICHYHRTGSFPKWYHYQQQEAGALAHFLACVSGARGPAYVVSTACSSSAKAFVSARSLLEMGVVDAILVGGVDSLCKLTVRGFASLELVSPTYASPMSRNRAGLNIGEGAALFVMTREHEGVQLCGIGESSDAYHMSTPEPTGKGAIAAMTLALEDADCKATEVAYINLHGTGTYHNDLVEASAVNHVFGCETLCSSSKAIFGHTLGAAGALELGVCWMLLTEAKEHGTAQLPIHLWDGEEDDSLADVKLVLSKTHVVFHNKLRVVSNSFAFGGSNCSVVLGCG